MRLLYCYVHFLDQEGEPARYRGLEKIEFNFSTVDRFSYDYETNTLTRKERTCPLPDNFWSDDFSQGTKTNIYNINVISGENGSGKTTAIRYLIDLLNGIHAAADPTVKDRGRMEKLGVDGNRTLLLFEEAGKEYLIDYDPFVGEHGKAFRAEGFPEKKMRIFHGRNWRNFLLRSKSAKRVPSSLLRTKVIFLTNALSQSDYERNRGENNNLLRDYFAYDASIGATIDPDIAKFFAFEAHKQVCYVFDGKQTDKQLAYKEQFPELIMPQALRLRLREEIIVKFFTQSDPTAYGVNNASLPKRLGAFCSAAFIEDLNSIKNFNNRSLLNVSSIPLDLERAKTTLKDTEVYFENELNKTRLAGHKDIVNCITSLPSGISVSGSYDHTLRVWDLRSGECLHTLEGHSNWVSCLAVTDDGRCVSGSYDHTLRVWDLRSGECLHTLEGHEYVVRCLAVTPDGLCVSGSGDHTLRVWDLRSGECLHTLEGHSDWVSCLAVTPDGRCVSGSLDNTLRVWDLRSGECLHTLEGHSNAVTCLAVTPDGLCVSGSRDGTLCVWDPRSGELLHMLDGHRLPVTCVAVTSDGYCVSGSNDNSLRVWDLHSGTCLHSLRGHRDSVTNITISEKSLCVSGSNDKAIRVWDIKTGTCLYCSEKQSAWITCIAALPDGRIISGNQAGDIILDKSLLPPNEAQLKARALRDSCLDYVRFLEEKSDTLFSRFQQIDENTYELSLDALSNIRSKSLAASDEQPDAQEMNSPDEEAAKALYRDLIDFIHKYIQTCKPTYTLDFDWGLSSGEENMLRLFSNLYHVYDPEDGGGERFIYNNESHSGDGKKRTKCDSVLIFLDEADLTLHPEWQRRLILILTTFLPQLFPPDCVKDMQVILSTHSPLLLGDIPGENITYLPSKQRREPRSLPEETFGQNIHTILKESFFLENGTVGAFAAKRINSVAQRLDEIGKKALNTTDSEARQTMKGELQALKREIDIVAPGVLRARLEQLYRSAETALRPREDVDKLLAEVNRLSQEERQYLLTLLNKGDRQP